MCSASISKQHNFLAPLCFFAFLLLWWLVHKPCFPRRRQSMSHASSTITVVAGLIQQGGRLLVCQRRRDGAFALKWEFPGGKVELGETYENGLRRELREELGIEAHIGPEAYRTRHDYPGKYAVELLFYHVVDF